MKVCIWRQDFHFWVNCTKTQFLPQQPMEILQSRGFIGHHRLFGKTATYHVTDFQFSRASWRGRVGEQSASPPQTHRDSISQLHAPAHYPWPVVSNQSSASENPGSFVFRADLRKPPTQKLLRLTNADTKPPFFSVPSNRKWEVWHVFHIAAFYGGWERFKITHPITQGPLEMIIPVDEPRNDCGLRPGRSNPRWHTNIYCILVNTKVKIDSENNVTSDTHGLLPLIKVL